MGQRKLPAFDKVFSAQVRLDQKVLVLMLKDREFCVDSIDLFFLK